MMEEKQFEVEIFGKVRAKFRVKSNQSKKEMEEEVKRQFLEFLDRYGVAAKVKRIKSQPLQSGPS